MKPLLVMMLLAQPALAQRAVLIAATIAGQPPPETQALEKQLGDVLAGAQLSAAIAARLGPVPERLTPSALSLLQARVKQSERNLFFNGTRVRESIADLEDARTRLDEAQGSLAHDRDARALLQYVLVKLTRAYQIEHVPDANRLADARMAELVRLFPDRPLDPEHYERELFELYDRARKRIVTDGRLTVPLPPGALLYVEGMPTRDATVILAPGPYHVFASDGKHDGRVHRIEVARETELSIDLPLETALVGDPPVLNYDSATTRMLAEPRLVARLGRLLGASRVYVLAGANDAPSLTTYDVGAGERALIVPHDERAAPQVSPATMIRAPPGDDRQLHRLAIAGWTTLAAGLPAATVGAALWPRSPGARVGIPLVAAGGTLALMGTDWLLVVAAIRGRHQVARTLAVVAGAWAVAALAGGLAQMH